MFVAAVHLAERTCPDVGAPRERTWPPFVEMFQIPNDPCEIEVSKDALTSCFSQSLPQFVIFQHAKNGCGKRSRILRGNKESALFVLYDLWHAANGRGNNRQSRGHVLQDDIWQSLRPGVHGRGSAGCCHGRDW